MIKNNSRGMSTILATLLIIMLTIVAIVIVWVVLKSVISNQADVLAVKNEFFAENVEISALKFEGGVVSLSLKRTGREVDIQKNLHITETTIQVESDVVSVIDLSGSMVSCNGVSYDCCRYTLGSTSYLDNNCYGVNTNMNLSCLASPCNGVWVDRLTPTKEANRQLLNIISEVEGSRIGFVVYSNNVISFSSIDLTDDIDLLNNTINSWHATGSTCICCGINDASSRLQLQSSEEKIKKIIVMSDGEANVECPAQPGTDPMLDAINAARDANSSLENLTIYSIGFGEDVNHDTLKAIADAGNGKNFSALDLAELIEAYNEVSQEIITSSIISNRFNYLYIVFYNETDNYREKIDELPQNLGIKSYDIDLTGKLEGEIIKIEVYPVILLKSNKEEIGPLFDSWTLVE